MNIKDDTRRMQEFVTQKLQKWHSVYELTTFYYGKFDINTYSRIRNYVRTLLQHEKLMMQEVSGKHTKVKQYKIK